MIRYDKLVPADSFLGRWMQYMSRQETSASYDFWCGVWLLGAVLGRNVIVARPRAPVFMNWYVLLVAESGVTRKSTAVREATKLLRLVIPRGMHIISSRENAASLEHRLHKQTAEFGYAHAAISIPELVTFLGRNANNVELPGLLTDLYDSAEERSGGGTISRGDVNIRNIYVTFLSASAPSWLVRSVTPEVVEGGFTSRCLFIHDEKPKTMIPWPEESNGNPHAELVEKLRNMWPFGQGARLELTPKAMQWFRNWYVKRELHRDPFRSSFESREDAHVLRLAGMFCINDDTKIVMPTHIRSAIRVIETVKEDGAMIFEQGLRPNKLAYAIDMLRRELIAAGMTGVTQGQLTMKLKHKMNASDLVNALRIMQELQMVQCFESVITGVGRPKTIWRATKAITAERAMDLITEKLDA